jgi:hypothetical protein
LSNGHEKLRFQRLGLGGFWVFDIFSDVSYDMRAAKHNSLVDWHETHAKGSACICTGTGRLGDEKRRKTDSTKTCVGLFRIRMVGPGFLPPPATHKDVCRGGHTESRSREGLKESIHRLIHSIEMYPGSFLHEYRFTKMRIAALAPPQPPPHTSRSPLSVVGR